MISTFIRNLLWDIQKRTGIYANPIKNFPIAGYTISLDINDPIQRCIYFHDFERDETRWIYNTLKPGMVVVDAGSHIGYYSLIASSLVGDSGKVYSFDPDISAYEKLRISIEQNKISNIYLSKTGLSDCSEERELFLEMSSETAPSFCFPDGYNHLNVKATSLGFSKLITMDQFAEDNHIECIDLIKMDVEGYEPKVLQGMSKLLNQNKVHRIMTELHGYWLLQTGSSPEKIDTLLKSYGFVLEYNKMYRCRPDQISLGNSIYVNNNFIK